SRLLGVYALAALIKQITQRLFNRYLWLPACRAMKTAVITALDRHIHRDKACRVHLDINFRAAEAEQRIEQELDAVGVPRCNVIHLPGLSFFGDQAVSSHDIAYIGKIALWREIA